MQLGIEKNQFVHEVACGVLVLHQRDKTRGAPRDERTYIVDWAERLQFLEQVSCFIAKVGLVECPLELGTVDDEDIEGFLEDHRDSAVSVRRQLQSDLQGLSFEK